VRKVRAIRRERPLHKLCPESAAPRPAKRKRRREVPLAAVVWAVLAVGVIVSYVAVRYVAALPEAPVCPTCRAVTGQPGRTTGLDRALARLGGAARVCPRCGWAGRMRWRLAPQGVDRG
jgi:hypothetical protein